jgi:CRISPR/Cas system-associated exonuclease Cas4 (RecB family)
MSDIVVYKVQKKDLTEWIKMRIQELEDSLDNHKVPQGGTSGLCKFCRYQTKCYNYGGGLITKPLSVPN